MKPPRQNIALLRGFILLLVFSSCNPTKYLQEDQHLLKKVKVHYANDNKLDKEQVEAIIKQQPNRKLLRIIPFHVSVYNLADKGKEKKIKTWLKEAVGEKPVIYDEKLTAKSTDQLNLYLKNKGYFKGEVRDSVVLENKTAEAHYFVEPNRPYTISKISYSIPDTTLLRPIKEISKKSLIKPGNNYDVELFERERERLSNEMKDLGYYYFSKEYIFFSIDSAYSKKRKAILNIIIKNPLEEQTIDGKDTLVEVHHKRYFINDVIINTRYAPLNDSTITDTIVLSGIRFVNRRNQEFKPELLLKTIYIEPGESYRLKNTEYTYNRIAALRTFKFINIRFEEVEDSAGSNLLNCNINLSPSPKQSFTFETEGSNSRIDYGIEGNLIYRNKNAFKGAEVLQLKLRGRLEAQKNLAAGVSDDESLFQGEEAISKVNPFNTLEYGPQLNLFLPDLLFFRKIKGLPKYQTPTTTFSAAFSHQKRPEYIRDIINLSFGYSWKTSKNKSYIVYPFDVSSVKIDPQPAFEERLNESNNLFLKNQYSNHLLTASRVSFIYNTKSSNKLKNFVFFRTNLEAAGNMLRSLSNDLNLPQNQEDGSYDLFGIRYAQYVKTDLDFRYYTVINRNSNLVYRVFGGVGLPFKNLNVLPFEKSYFAGGSNDLRAWQTRRLGPGSLPDSLYSGIVHIGDMQLEGNVEYRFDVIKYLEGAAFVDAGNIWLLNPDETRPGGEFEFNRFYKEIAIGAGLGARLDFNFFLIRVDAALQLHDPALVTGERWLFQPKEFYNASHFHFNNDGVKVFDPYKPQVNFNLGIGYPF